MKRKIAIFTTTRAEFGIFCPLIELMSEDEQLEPLLFVGGTHLVSAFGSTINEITDQGFKIKDTFDYVLKEDDCFSISRSLGTACCELAHIFKKYEFDFVCVLGDRFELLSIISNAIIFRKPIIHISGGERTAGVIDDQVRHMISKAAHLHFVSCDEYADNLFKMGEPEERIHNTGALNVDNMKRSNKISKLQLFKELNLDVYRPTVLMCYHPVTLEFSISLDRQLENLFDALESFNLQVVITAPNVETDRNKIVSFLKKKVALNRNIHYFNSLGFKRYHSLIACCEFVIGNSSSGISEVPFFKIPTVNIGDRQKGRKRHESVIDTDYSTESIKSGIEKALSEEYKTSLHNMEYKFGDGHAAEKMICAIKNIEITKEFLQKKLNFVN